MDKFKRYFAGSALLAVAAAALLAFVLGPVRTMLVRPAQAQYATTHQPALIYYGMPVYDSVAALLADGAAPTAFRIALTRGGQTNYDGNGGLYLWSNIALTSTNTNTVFAVPGLTNSSGTLVGRWFSLNSTAFPHP